MHATTRATQKYQSVSVAIRHRPHQDASVPAVPANPGELAVNANRPVQAAPAAVCGPIEAGRPGIRLAQRQAHGGDGTALRDMVDVSAVNRHDKAPGPLLLGQDQVNSVLLYRLLVNAVPQARVLRVSGQPHALSTPISRMAASPPGQHVAPPRHTRYVPGPGRYCMPWCWQSGHGRYRGRPCD